MKELSNLQKSSYGTDDVNYNPMNLMIKNYINNNNKSEDFDEILIKDNNFEVFLNFSKTRQSILNWYDFKEDADLLEIGGEFGALTGMLCEKCKSVTCIERDKLRAESILKRYENRNNLELFNSVENIINFNKKYDYIVLIGTIELIENIEEYLKKIKGLLKSEGAILIATENRLGLKYFCGASYPTLENPFDGINKRFKKNGRTLYTKSELENIIKSSGLKINKFYYPVPDYKFAQEIYSDTYLPKGALKERIMPYYLNSKSLIADEMYLYDDIIENNVFEVFANSFLIECREIDAECKIDYIAVSTDRKAENAYATVVYSNKTVKKKPLFSQGIQGINDSYNNIKELELRGLNTVDTKINNNELNMPFLKANTLSKVLQNYIKYDRDKALNLFECLYKDILKSSEHVNPNLCYLNQFSKKTLDMGVILKHAYIDMVPVNCFYEYDKLIYFDQEFKMDYFPANYVMFRSIKYTYLTIKETDNIALSEGELKDKYGLNNLWDFYESIDIKFVVENRQFKIYKNYLSWINVDQNIINQNSKLLTGI
ncbi:2-polyprenyl-3-methyl-5-hydroxy-6-metoxy-1,4-benzoquinol methylase [Paeniclostridium ghonii]|uniref:2-polyprenyl-3-methyl-5-hydroxy-6-metoxy-1, 4-benzoquinol methylase n=1 Tax=Paraclostridium ghonii TaxID=29358 RepID=A0ABU0MWG4_9FIRM|nr:2-polyprenyl-3-methyl-5-hydroxy-6-metoxy-1,4-benzoquinol methylase [Paeniclostridium ghonii]